jgi:hypothetical protein
MKITEGYDLVLEPSSDTNWCEPRNHGHATHNQDWNLILESRNRSNRSVTPWSHLIFDKSDSIRSRTEECKKNHLHVKTEKFRSNNHQRLLKFWLPWV